MDAVTVSQCETRQESKGPHPTKETTREEFFEVETGTYSLSFRFVQTAAVGTQVPIEELAEFAGDIRNVLESYSIPVCYDSVEARDVTISTKRIPWSGVSDVEVEETIESLAEEHSIGLEKHVSLSKSGDGSVFVKYKYGFGQESGFEHQLQDPDCPTANVSWVGGYRGRPEMMFEVDPVRIVSVETREPCSRASLLEWVSSAIPL